MSDDPVLGNAARWHSTSPLYGQSIWVPALFGMRVFWEGLPDGVGTLLTHATHRADLDASRHDL